MRLHTNFRSTAAYRVRIALHLKGLEYDPRFVSPADGDDELFFQSELETVNPQRMVPVLEHGDLVLTQSLAICEYLDEVAPQTPLLPADAAGRARVRSLGQIVACDIHPLNTPRVLIYLDAALNADGAKRQQWMTRWMALGFESLERRLAADDETGEFCHGDTPGLADICLVPQVTNAECFDVDVMCYPTVARIVARCRQLDAFTKTAPALQPDAQS